MDRVKTICCMFFAEICIYIYIYIYTHSIYIYIYILNYNNTGLYFCRAQNKHGNQSSAEIQLTAEGEFTQSKCKKQAHLQI